MESNPTPIHCGHNVIQLYYPVHRIKGESRPIVDIMDEKIKKPTADAMGGNWIKTEERVVSGCTADGTADGTTDDQNKYESFESLRRIVPAAYFMTNDNNKITFWHPTSNKDSNLKGFSKSRQWIDDKYVQRFFHPAFRNTLFGSQDADRQDHTEHAHEVVHYRKQWPLGDEAGSGYPGELFLASLPGDGQTAEQQILFEWLSYELFVFSDDIAIAVVRISVLENHKFCSKTDEPRYLFDRNTTPTSQQNIPLTDWMRFADVIRQIYEKYEGQPHFSVSRVDHYQQAAIPSALLYPNDVHDDLIELSVEHKMPDKFPQTFFEIIMENAVWPEGMIFSEIANPSENNPEKNLEPNAFIHAYVEWEGNVEELSINQLFSLLSVDGTWNDSGKDPDFIRQFTEKHLLRRWSPTTIYTAIDYAAVTLSRSQPQYTFHDKHTFRMSDLFYQHHARHYVWFILFQLYYRNVLQDLARQYAAIGQDAIERRGSKAQEGTDILKDYYFLNQHRFFERVTNEIQGLEIWSLYQEAMGIKPLFQAVREDVRELNQRLIESHGEKQELWIKWLTVMGVLIGASTVMVTIAGLSGVDQLQKGRPGILNDVVMYVLHLRSFAVVVGIVAFLSVPIYALGYLIISRIKKIWGRHRRR